MRSLTETAGASSQRPRPVSYTHLDVYKRQVALRATSVAGRSQPQAAAMFSMTRRAVRGKQLVRVVNGAVVAGFAGLVAGFGAENAGLFYVARAALLGQYSMARGHLPAAVDVIVAGQPVPGQPDNRERRHTDG